MSVMDVSLRGRTLTVADIELMPDDGQRYELIDGVLLVSPTPFWQHQGIVGGLYMVLRAAAPADLRVMTAPAAVILDERSWVEPDVFVARKADFGEKYLDAAPVLAVEVLSPSTRLQDLNTKFARYERAGIESYWVVNPDKPRLIAWELVDGRYVEVANVVGDETWTTTRPFPITVTPAALLD